MNGRECLWIPLNRIYLDAAEYAQWLRVVRTCEFGCRIDSNGGRSGGTEIANKYMCTQSPHDPLFGLPFALMNVPSNFVFVVGVFVGQLELAQKWSIATANE